MDHLSHGNATHSRLARCSGVSRIWLILRWPAVGVSRCPGGLAGRQVSVRNTWSILSFWTESPLIAICSERNRTSRSVMSSGLAIGAVICWYSGESTASTWSTSLTTAAPVPVMPDRPGRVGGRSFRPGLQLIRCALGNHRAMIDGGDPVGKLVRLVKVLGGEHHGRSGGYQMPNGIQAVPGFEDQGRWWAHRGRGAVAER